MLYLRKIVLIFTTRGRLCHDGRFERDYFSAIKATKSICKNLEEIRKDVKVEGELADEKN